MMAFTLTPCYNTGYQTNVPALLVAARNVSKPMLEVRYVNPTPRSRIGRIRYFWTPVRISRNRRVQGNGRAASSKRTNCQTQGHCQERKSLQRQTPRVRQNAIRCEKAKASVVRGSARLMSLVRRANDGQVRNRSYKAAGAWRNERSIQSLRLPSQMQSTEGSKTRQAVADVLVALSVSIMTKSFAGFGGMLPSGKIYLTLRQFISKNLNAFCRVEGLFNV